MIIQFLKNKFFQFLERQGRKRIIMDRVDNEPYLERYYVFLKDRTWFPFNVFLHKFLKSDPDDVHDHPWPYATLILKGGYWDGCHNSTLKEKKLEKYRIGASLVISALVLLIVFIASN